MKVIDDWLEDKLASRKMVLGYVEDASEFSMLAGALRAEAQAAGLAITRTPSPRHAAAISAPT